MKKSFISIIQRAWRRYYCKKKYGNIENQIIAFQNFYRKFAKKGSKYKFGSNRLKTISVLVSKVTSKNFINFLGLNRAQTVAQIIRVQLRFRSRCRALQEKRRLRLVLQIQRLVRGFLARKEMNRRRKDYRTIKSFLLKIHFRNPSESYKIVHNLIYEDIFELFHQRIKVLRKIKKAQALYRGYESRKKFKNLRDFYKAKRIINFTSLLSFKNNLFYDFRPYPFSSNKKLSFNIFYTQPASLDGITSKLILGFGIIEIWLCHPEYRKYISLLRDYQLYMSQSGLSLSLSIESEELYFPLKEKKLFWLPGTVLKASYMYKNKSINKSLYEIIVNMKCKVFNREYSISNFILINKYSPRFIKGFDNMVYPVQKLNIMYYKFTVESVALIIYDEHSNMKLEKVLNSQDIGIIKLHYHYNIYKHTEDVVTKYLPMIMSDSFKSRFIYFNLLKPNIVSNKSSNDKKVFYTAEYRNQKDAYALQKVIYKQQKNLKICNSLYVICFDSKSLGIPQIVNSIHFLFLKSDFIDESMDELLDILQCENCTFRETSISNIVFNTKYINYSNIIKTYYDQQLTFKFNILYLKSGARTTRSSTITNAHTNRSSTVSNYEPMVPHAPKKPRLSKISLLNRVVTEYHQ